MFGQRLRLSILISIVFIICSRVMMKIMFVIGIEIGIMLMLMLMFAITWPEFIRLITFLNISLTPPGTGNV